jgi:hypothetical protein
MFFIHHQLRSRTLINSDQLLESIMFNLKAHSIVTKSNLALALAISIYCIFVTSAIAQPQQTSGRVKEQTTQPGSPPPAPGGRNAENTLELLSSLKLNAQQSKSVKAILEEDQKAAEEMRQAMRTKIDALHAATKQKLAKVLNAEQLGRYEEFKQANRPPRPPGEPPRRD